MFGARHQKVTRTPPNHLVPAWKLRVLHEADENRTHLTSGSAGSAVSDRSAMDSSPPVQSWCFFHSIHVSSCIRLVTQLSCICRTTIWPLAKDSLEERDESHPITTPAADPPEGSIHRSRGRSSSSDCRVVAKSSSSTLRTADIQTLTRVKPCSVIAVLSAQNLYTGARLNISAVGRPYREQARTAARPEACSQWTGAPPRSDCCLALPGDYSLHS